MKYLSDVFLKIHGFIRRIILFNLIFPFCSLGKRAVLLNAAQQKEEIDSFLSLLKGKNILNMCEIGSYRGGTLYVWCRIINKTAKIIAIDSCFRESFAMETGSKAIKVLSKFKTRNQKLFFVDIDSHSEEARKKVLSILDGDKLDFLFIDGDHSYEGVKSDFENYRNLVNKGGIIAFHDIVPGLPELVGGVPKFWQEIKSKYNTHYELVKDWNQGGFGIGVLII